MGPWVVLGVMLAVLVLAFAVDAHRRWSWRLIAPPRDGDRLDDPGHQQLEDRQLYQDIGHTMPELLGWVHRERNPIQARRPRG